MPPKYLLRLLLCCFASRTDGQGCFCRFLQKLHSAVLCTYLLYIFFCFCFTFSLKQHKMSIHSYCTFPRFSSSLLIKTNQKKKDRRSFQQEHEPFSTSIWTPTNSSSKLFSTKLSLKSKLLCVKFQYDIGGSAGGCVIKHSFPFSLQSPKPWNF